MLSKINARTDFLHGFLTFLLTFCMKLQKYTDLKLTKMIFLGKNHFLKFCTKSSPKGARNEVFAKSMHGTFLIFCMKLQLSEVRARLFGLKPS